MPRLIILLLTLASLTLVTLQNLGEDRAVSLVILGQPLSSIPLGLLLLGSVGIGALSALVLYGLVGLRRPADSATKSKYKPMGSRVPYSESGSTIPPTGSYSAPTGSTASSTAGSAAYSSGGTAFVTEPPVDSAGTPPSNPNPAVSSAQPSGTPTTPSNVYSPFSRDSEAKKKGPTAK